MMKRWLIILFLPAGAGVALLLISVAGRDQDVRSSVSASNRLDELKSLPYLAWTNRVNDLPGTGVVHHDPDRAFDGYNFYADDGSSAYLLDNEGRVVHQWRFPAPEEGWEYAELSPDSSLIAYCDGKALVRLDRDSEVLWRQDLPFHHDIALRADGTMVVPVSKPHRLYRDRLVEFDSLLILSPRGEVTGEWSTYENLERIRKCHLPSLLDTPPEIGGFKRFIRRFYTGVVRPFSTGVYELDKFLRFCCGLGEKFSYYHLNTVEILPENPRGREDRRFAPGNYLVCLRNVDLILILDPEFGEILWSWGPGELDWPHMPTMLENGNILVYDNGYHRGYSRILEIDPLRKEIVWEYRADPPQAFYSKTRGSSQRLPNGNTLVCESESGRVFEVTVEGETVWEFLNPEVKDNRRKMIYRMMRFSPERIGSWLPPGMAGRGKEPQVSSIAVPARPF